MKKLIMTGLLLSTTASFAGSMTVKGISNIGKTPEYIELSVSTLAKCYKTAKESNAAAEAAALKLKNILESHMQLTAGDQIVFTAGNSSRVRETESILNPRTNRHETSVICEKGWRSSRQVIAKFSDLNLFETLNPLLLDEIDNIELNQRVENENGVVSASIAAPIPRLMPETIEAMQTDALKDSLQNASKKFEVVKELCSLVNVSIENISEARAEVRPYRDNTGSGSTDNSLNFALQYVHLAYNITFGFDNTTGSCLATTID